LEHFQEPSRCGGSTKATIDQSFDSAGAGLRNVSQGLKTAGDEFVSEKNTFSDLMLWDVPGIWIPGCKICSHEKYTPGSTNMAGWKMDPD